MKTIGPVVMERHDQENGEINYELWDYNRETYHRLCLITEDTSDCALHDARLIESALAVYIKREDPEIARLREALRAAETFVADEWMWRASNPTVTTPEMVAKARDCLAKIKEALK